MLRWPWIALALGGCDLAFGLETVDQPARKVTGQYVQRTVFNDADFKPMQSERVVPPSEISMQAYLDDDVVPTPVDYRDDGTFSFPVERRNQPYRLQVTIEGNTSELQDNHSELVLGQLIAGRPDRAAVQSTYLMFNYSAPRSAVIASTGIYTYSDTGMTGNVMWDWRLASPVGGSVTGLLDASQHDRIYALEHEAMPAGTNNSPQWFRIKSVYETSISQSLGSTAVLQTPQPRPPDACIHITTSASKEKKRIQDTHPRTYHEATGYWIPYSVPAPQWTAMSGALYPAFCQYFTGIGLAINDLDVSPRFHDPFPGTTSVVETGVGMYFYVQLPGTTTSAQQLNVSRIYSPVPRGTATCTQAATRLDHTIGLVGDFEINGMNLNADNLPLTLPAGVPPRFSWTQLADGPIDYVTVNIHEVAAINGQTKVIQRFPIALVGTSALLDPAYLEEGHTYMIAVTVATGRPAAADGNWRDISVPYEINTTWTHSFQVHYE